ncbi:hypothetical protein [Prevotella merdae]|uniref:hypothetical protein n=1 Tax=Prevotella merdae TaxID=2079531 RepID=UPI00356704A7
MAQLSTIISSILRDMVHAQHEANMYAITLEDAYKAGGRLERFSLPAVAVGDIELELRYGITDDSSLTEQYEVNYPQLATLYKSISTQLARTIVNTTLPQMQSVFADSVGHDNEMSTLSDLIQLKDIQKRFITFLGRKILHAMQIGFTTLIASDGTLNQQMLSQYAVKVGTEEILEHKDLVGLFDTDADDDLRNEIVQEMTNAVDTVLPQLLQDVNIKRKRLLPSVDVTVKAEELSHLPEECIHTLHFKVSPNSIKFYTDQNH